MLNIDAINKIYKLIINDIELTTKNLKASGFSSYELSKLIEENILERVERGHYRLLNDHDLYEYAKSLISKKEYEKAVKCFKKCYEINPNNYGVVRQLFKDCIEKKDYESILIFFEKMKSTNNPFYITDHNLYLYLLSFIIDLPDKYKEQVEKMKFEDICVLENDSRYYDIEIQNRIRKAIFDKKILYAIKMINSNKNNGFKMQDVIIKKLLGEIIELQKNIDFELLKIIDSKKYDEAILYLQDKKLSLRNSYILKLLYDFNDISVTKEIPAVKSDLVSTVFEAIDGYDYFKALEITKEYNNKRNIVEEENIIYILLSEICSLITELSQNENDNSYKESYDNEDVISSNTFSDIVNYLMRHDFENGFKALKNYLFLLNKSDYEFFLVSLIKLSILEHDDAFTKPMIALTLIGRDKFKFDSSVYLQNFYITLSENRFEEARIYLDILSSNNKVGQSNIMTDQLLKVLEHAKKVFESKHSNITFDEINVALEKNENLVFEDSPEINNSYNGVKEHPAEKIKPFIKEENTLKNKSYKNTNAIISEREFIENKYQQLVSGPGIILLKPMDSNRRKRIHQLVKEYPDMVSFSINSGFKRRIVLCYHPYINEYINIGELFSMGNSFYREKDYDSCIECYTKLLQFGKSSANVYAKLGLAYMKKMNIDVAIDFLTVATEISKTEDCKFDFFDLIFSLKEGDSLFKEKPKFYMNLEEFNDNSSYGIDNIDELSLLIYECGFDLKSACKELGYDEDQINIVKLICAKEHYYQGNYDNGDRILKEVECSKNKSKFVISLFDEIRKNRKFYIHRSSETVPRLCLTKNPNKF